MTAEAVIVFAYLAVLGLVVAGFWLVFMKAGESGWKSIIPIWNMIVLLRIIGRPWWWIAFFIIPFVGLIVSALIAQDFAKSFGKGVGFGLGLWLLSFIFVPILGFGGATYAGPAAEGTWGEGSVF